MDGSSIPRRIPLKIRRLQNPLMYKRVFENGRTLRGSPLTLRYFRAEQDCSRVGFIIRKRTGNAPMRNSIRRTLRRTFQESLPQLGEGAWVVFDVSDKAASFSRAALRQEAERLLKAAGSAPGSALSAPRSAAPASGAAATAPRAAGSAP